MLAWRAWLADADGLSCPEVYELRVGKALDKQEELHVKLRVEPPALL